MSYTIEYSSEVYKVPAEWEKSSENNYLLIITQGDNNVYEASPPRRRARSTYICGYGWNYSIIGTICNRAGSCEGGGLQVGSNWITPESYLKRYRTKIKNAPLITEFFKLGRKARFELKINPDSEYDKERLEEFKEYIHEETSPYSGEKELWAEITITDKESFEKMRSMWSLARFHDINIGEA